MRIDSLTTSITEMNLRQAYEFILSLRKRRRLAPAVTPTKRKRTSAKKKPNISALLNSLTPEQAAQLLKQLGGS